MKANDLREKSDEELDEILVGRTEDIMHFRLQTATILKERSSGASSARSGDGE